MKKNVEVSNKPKKNYNDVSNYKPTGMIYSSELIKTIKDKKLINQLILIQILSHHIHLLFLILFYMFVHL